MNQKTYKTAVVIIPPQGIWSPIQKIRYEHDRHVQRWMPHITLLYPFRSKDQFVSIIPRFQQALQDVEVFFLTLQEFGYFTQRRGYTLWLKPDPSHLINELQMCLQKCAPECDDVRKHKHGFTPHLTLGQFSKRESINERISIFQQDWIPMSFQVNSIHLLWREEPPNDRFRIAKTLVLGEEK